MRWKKLRRGGEDSKVEHRRGSGGGGVAMGGGLGAIIMALVAIFVFKQDPQKVIGGLVEQGGSSTQQSGPPSELDKETEDFIERIKVSTDDIWTALFQKVGKRYETPKMVNYDVHTRMKTGGVADARMGPFYLPAEKTIYIDVAFFKQMEQQLGGGGDFAYAYVVAHEVGHHVQHLIGNTDKVHKKKGRVSEREYNQLSVRLELQADFLAGVWAHYADKQMRQKEGHGLLQEGDVEEAMRAAKAIGDDALQRQAGGRVVEDSFTHGSSEQRLRWFTKGLRSGDLSQMDTFAVPYHSL